MPLTVSQELEPILCGECGIEFAVPELWLAQRRQQGGSFTCPNGHGRRFCEPENDKLKKSLRQAEAQLAQEREQREAAQRELEKTKQRIAGGACPCCKRTFKALHRHMAAKHPDYKGT